MQQLPIRILVLLAALCLTLSSCKKEEEEKKTQASPNYIELTDEQLNMMEIKQAKFTNQNIRPIVMANGRIGVNANHTAKMSSNVSGRIERLFVEEGSLVQKGQPILSISSMEYVQLQEDYMKAYSEAMYYEKEYNRQQELRGANVASLADFQSTESKYNSAMAAEKSLRAKLAVLKKDAKELRDAKNATINHEKMIFAPISGYVYKLPASIGMRANPEITLVDIVDLSALRAEIFVYEKDLDKIDVGSEVEIEFINKRIPKVTGTIKLINRSIDDLNKTVMLLADFEKPKGALILPEMFFNAKVRGNYKGEAKLAVPVSALIQEGYEQCIFTILKYNGKSIVKKIKVKVGVSDDQYAQITPEEPLDDSSTVATTNLLILDTELRKMSVK